MKPPASDAGPAPAWAWLGCGLCFRRLDSPNGARPADHLLRCTRCGRVFHGDCVGPTCVGIDCGHSPLRQPEEALRVAVPPLDTRPRRALPPVLPAAPTTLHPRRSLREVPTEVSVPLSVIALAALITNASATLVFLILCVALTLVHRALFRPDLAATEYLAALAADLEAVVEQLKRQNMPAIVGAVAAALLLVWFPHVWGGVLGTLALVLLLFYAGRPATFEGTRGLGAAELVSSVSTAARSWLRRSDVCLGLLALAPLAPLFHLLTVQAIPLPGAVVATPLFKWALVILCSAAGIVWVVLARKSTPPDRTGGGPAPTRAQRIFLTAQVGFSLGLVSAVVWFSQELELSFPFGSSAWNGVLTASPLVLAFLAGLRVPARRMAESQAGLAKHHVTVWGTSILTLTGVLAWRALPQVTHAADSWRSWLAYGMILALWLGLALLMVEEVLDEEGSPVPEWVTLQVAAMACLLVAFVCLRFEGPRGLLFAAVPIGFMILNTGKTCVRHPESSP